MEKHLTEWRMREQALRPSARSREVVGEWLSKTTQ